MDASTSDCGYSAHPRCMWQPRHSWSNTSTSLGRFRHAIEQKYHTSFGSYKELHEWSVNDYAEFWEECFRFFDVVHSAPYSQVIDKKKKISDVPQWFEGCRLNYAENLLRYRDDRVAIYGLHEGSLEVRQRTFGELYSDVSRLAAAMKSIGVKSGDRVVGYLPNCIETVEAMLAAASIGAIWSASSPDFGVTGVLDKFSQIQPSLMFSVNAVMYNGKLHNHLDKLKQVAEGLPELKKVVVIPYVTCAGEDATIGSVKNGISLADFVDLGTTENGTPELQFEQLPFSHPLFIMYSSGTTGIPKCMVHSAGGSMIKHLEEHILQSDMTRNDVMLYYTTAGWMMWNWYVTSLAVGSAIVCYDGSPFVPHASMLFDIIDKIGVTMLGASAKYLDVLQERAAAPAKTHSLTTLRTILSTGSPLKPQLFDFVYTNIKSDVVLGSVTGGTDIIACFAGNNVLLPVYRGEIQSLHLGCAVQSWSDAGKPVYGRCGELVCVQPFPSMPTHFWNDPDGSLYKNAYFNKFPGVWAHGDYCLISANTGGIWMLGRSDGTLNPGGVRFGSTEIYHVVESFKEVQDSLCVAQKCRDGSDERVVLFLKMAPGIQLSTEFIKQVQLSIRKELSARHVPAVILQIADIPYTHSGKKVEVAVKKILNGEDVKVRSAYANPDSLDLYYIIPELLNY